MYTKKHQVTCGIYHGIPLESIASLVYILRAFFSMLHYTDSDALTNVFLSDVLRPVGKV